MKRLSIKLTAKAAALGLFLFLAVSSSSVIAQNSNDNPQGDQAQPAQGSDWKEQLNLTPDQLDKIRAIQEQNRVEGQPIRRRVVQAQRALDEAIYSDNADEAEIERLARELASAQADQVRMRAMTELKIRRVLTPEQLSTFRAIRRQRALENQMRRRQENANQARPLNNRRLENGVNQQTPRVRPNALPRKGRQ
ncbi:MAG: Spy/CpxP family protein refolding chaperone [Acidobacteriota bacterium]|nr:Spy/CpxP family protein refolding chaperone [Acidobacteriota bacterium]